MAIFKKKSKQTLKQYVENLDRHLNGSNGRGGAKKTAYVKVNAAKPNYTISNKKSVVESGFSQPKKESVKNTLATSKDTEAQSEKKNSSGKAYTPINPRSPESAKKFKKKSPVKKHLPKIAAVLSAVIVVLSAIFVINRFTGKEKNAKDTEPTQIKQVALENLEDSASPQSSPETAQINAASSGDYNITEPDSFSQTDAESTATVSPDEKESAETTPAPVDMELDVTSEIPPIPQDLLLHLDDTNEIVPFVQEYLMDLHYMDADEPTDFYGQQTEYAIQLFQRGHGLMVDGVAGYETLKLLFSDKATPYLVRRGDYGFDIYVVKKRLIELGYLDDKNTDKNFDEDTDYAVRVFQGRNKLSQDGIIGHNTIQVLLNGDAKPAKNYNTPSSDDGGSSSSGGGGSNASYDANSAADFVAFAKSIMNKGYTYIWGGKGPPGMDCSGFVYYSLNQTGNKIGYMTSAAWAKSSYTTISSIHDAKPGDILCFDGHVAICIGGGKMIDSSSSSNAIRIANYETSNYWNKKWVCAKRVFP